MNEPLDTSHDETYMKTDIDDKEVKEVIKGFDKDKIIAQIKSLKEEKEERANKDLHRTVSQASSIIDVVGNPDSEVTEDRADEMVGYYTSYDKHIELIDHEIENSKARILRDLKVIELLEQKREKIIKEKEEFDAAKDFEPEFHFTCSNKQDEDKLHSLIKAHLIKCHPGLIGKFYGSSVSRFTGSCANPHIEFISDGNGNVILVRCKECYEKHLIENTTETGEMSLHDYPGGR